MAGKKKSKAAKHIEEGSRKLTAAMEAAEDAFLNQAMEEARAQLTGGWLIRASYNFINFTIAQFERFAELNAGIFIPAQDIQGTLSLVVGIMDMSSQQLVANATDATMNAETTAIQKLVKAATVGSVPLDLDRKEVKALVQIFRLFPRNIILVCPEGGKEPFLRLMSDFEANKLQEEDKLFMSNAKLRKIERDFKIVAPKTYAQMMVEDKDDAQKPDLDAVILRLTPGIPRTPEIEKALLYAPPNAKEKFPDFVFVAGGMIYRNPDLPEGAVHDGNMTKDQLREEVKRLDGTLVVYRDAQDRFLDRCRAFVPVPKEHCDAVEAFNKIVKGMESLVREKDRAIRQEQVLRMVMNNKDQATADVLKFVDGIKQYFPHLRENFAKLSPVLVDAHLLLVTEGVKSLTNSLEEAKKNKDTSLVEISNNARLLAKQADVSQDGRHQDRIKFTTELEKKDAKLLALRQEFKSKVYEFEEFKNLSQKANGYLSSDLAKKDIVLQQKQQQIEILTSDYESCHSDLLVAHKESLSTKTKLDAKDSEIKKLRNDLSQAKSALLASRTNQQIEEDRIQKAVANANAVSEKHVQKLYTKIEVLESAARADQETITGLSQEQEASKQQVRSLEELNANLLSYPEHQHTQAIIQEAISMATGMSEKRIKDLVVKVEMLEAAARVDLKTITELSQDKYKLREELAQLGKWKKPGHPAVGESQKTRTPWK